MAGLRCPPEDVESAKTSTAIVRPKVPAMSTVRGIVLELKDASLAGFAAEDGKV